MPASYAHYTFGSHVLSHIEDISIKKIILDNHELFDIGLHGPDILFYYKPMTSNHVTKIGYGLHKKIASKFFTHARDVIRTSAGTLSGQNGALAYVLGFICHFTLDSECHGYVDEMMESLHISHTKIESELERYLLMRNHLNPITTKTTAHISTTPVCAKVIAPFFEIAVSEILHSLKSFKFYSNILMAPHKWERVLINIVLKLSGHYDFMHGLLISYKPEPKCEVTNEELYRRYENAVPIAISLIESYCETLKHNAPLNQRFECDFE